jgi:hypothetical protein
MERKLVGLLLTTIGIIGLIMADINLMEIISNPSYGNNLYNAGDKGSSGMAMVGYGAMGLIFIFLGIKKLRRPSEV